MSGGPLIRSRPERGALVALWQMRAARSRVLTFPAPGARPLAATNRQPAVAVTEEATDD